MPIKRKLAENEFKKQSGKVTVTGLLYILLFKQIYC